jgi:hypothetical protein
VNNPLFGPNLAPGPTKNQEKAGRQRLDCIGRRHIGRLGPLTLNIGEQGGRVVPDVSRYDLHRYASIQQRGRVDAPEVVEPCPAEAEQLARRANSFEKLRGLRGAVTASSLPISRVAGNIKEPVTGETG